MSDTPSLAPVLTDVEINAAYDSASHLTTGFALRGVERAVLAKLAPRVAYEKREAERIAFRHGFHSGFLNPEGSYPALPNPDAPPEHQEMKRTVTQDKVEALPRYSHDAVRRDMVLNDAVGRRHRDDDFARLSDVRQMVGDGPSSDRPQAEPPDRSSGTHPQPAPPEIPVWTRPGDGRRFRLIAKEWQYEDGPRGWIDILVPGCHTPADAVSLAEYWTAREAEEQK